MYSLFGQNNMVCQFGSLRIWAERGLIHIEDAKDNSYTVVAVRTALKRMQAISDMLRNSRVKMLSDKAMYGDEFDRQMKMLDQMTEVCRKAQVQGMPSDASARRDLKRRLPTTVTVPKLNYAM